MTGWQKYRVLKKSSIKELESAMYAWHSAWATHAINMIKYNTMEIIGIQLDANTLKPDQIKSYVNYYADDEANKVIYNAPAIDVKESIRSYMPNIKAEIIKTLEADYAPKISTRG